MPEVPVTRVVLYKHGVGHFERSAQIAGDATLTLTFKQSEVSDVLKSLTVLDLDGGHVSSVSYDSTKPLEQLLAEVALHIPDQGSLVGLLPQIKGARVQMHTGVSDPVDGYLLGIDATERSVGDAVVQVTLVSVLTEAGEVRSFDLHQLAGLLILDPTLRRDLDFYLKTQLSAKKKDARTFTFFAQGVGERRLRLSYTLEAPVWKATYRILLGEEGAKPQIQGWAVVDNTQDEDWENVQLSLISGLPVSFMHDLYTPRYIRRPEVQVQETTGVLPPTMEDAMMYLAEEQRDYDGVGGADKQMAFAAAAPTVRAMRSEKFEAESAKRKSAKSSMPAQVRERKIGDLFEYEIEHPVTIRRNQSALVPIVLRDFDGKSVLLYNKQNRAENPMRCVEFKNTTGLTLEGGPVTVLETASYVGEAMLETIKPDEERLVPYCVELAVRVHDHVDSHSDKVHRVVIRKGTLKTLYQHVMKTTYHFDNQSEAEQIVYLEHPRQGREWELERTPTPAPKEITENFWRFRLTLAGKQTTKFVVQQKQTLQQAYGLADVNDQMLGVWLQQKYLDKANEKLLREVLGLRQQSAGFEANVQKLEKEKLGIHAEQKRIRENLQALGDRSAEKELRERFVKTLNVQEDRLEEIDRQAKDAIRQRDETNAKMHETLGKLEYETAL